MGSGGLDSEPFEQITFLNGIFMARVIDEGMKAQLSKKQGFFLKYFPARIRNVGEDAKEARKQESLSMLSRTLGMMPTSRWRRWWIPT